MQDPSARTSRGYLGNIPPVSIFKATPASVLSRFLAWIIDLIVIFIVVLFLFLVFDYSNDPPSSSNTGEADNETGALFLVALSYFVLAGRLTGKTIGKKMMGIKVVNKYDGELLSIWQSIGRTLLQFVDLFFWGLIGLISMEKSDQNQRVGDRAVGSIVIKDRYRP